MLAADWKRSLVPERGAAVKNLNSGSDVGPEDGVPRRLRGKWGPEGDPYYVAEER